MSNKHLVNVPLDGELKDGVECHDQAKYVQGVHQPEINQFVVRRLWQGLLVEEKDDLFHCVNCS